MCVCTTGNRKAFIIISEMCAKKKSVLFTMRADKFTCVKVVARTGGTYFDNNRRVFDAYKNKYTLIS